MDVRRRTMLLLAGLLLAGLALLAGGCGERGGATGAATAAPVPQLLGAGLAYDARVGAVVAFGGQARHGRVVGPSRATWRWTGSRWQRMHPRSAPPARSQALLATDPSSGAVVLFGGQAESHVVPSCPRPPPSPPPGPGAPACSGSVSPVRVLGDTWELGDHGWKRLAPGGHAPQQGRLLAGAPDQGAVVLVGRSTAMSTSGFDGTWARRADRWRLLSATAPEAATTMAYDPVTRRLVAFGGMAPFTPAPGMGAPAMPGYARTWVLGRHGWSEAHPATSPTRSSGVLTVSPDGSALLLVESSGTTWAWTGGDWRRYPTTGRPSGTVLAAATDPRRHEVVLVVGSAAGDATWTLRGGTWQSHGRAP